MENQMALSHIITLSFHHCQSNLSDFYCQVSIRLTFTSLWANLAEDKLVIFVLLFLENRFWHFMQIVSNGENFTQSAKR